jgi:hypothetical protein
MYVGYMQILVHFIERTQAPIDFGILTGLGTSSPWMEKTVP